MLLGMLDGRSAASVRMPAELVVRESTAAPGD
jgi:DNA-binding LacI/PurR family transcriptional regulator